jgi:signal transduction histidine kinase
MPAAVAAAGGWAASAVAVAVLRHALAARMELVARASHELRGPLTAAALGLELVERSGRPDDERISAVKLELARASLALEDLAAAGGRARVAPRIEPVEVTALVDACVLAARAYAAGCAVWGPGDRLPGGARGQRPAGRASDGRPGLRDAAAAAVVDADRVRLAQAIRNLLANAAEHGRGPVVAEVSSVGRSVRIEVTDCGPGLPAPVAELIRRPRRGRGSRGRGLAIAAGIAAAHGGRLAAAPAQQGARLVLELPAAPRRVRHESAE